MLEAYFFGYDHHGNQPSLQFSVGLEISAAINLDHIDAWLTDYLGIAKDQLQAQDDNPAPAGAGHTLAALRRALLLYGELLRAQNVPSFDSGRVIELRQRKAASTPTFQARISLPVIDNFPPAVFQDLFALSLKLVCGPLSEAPADAAAGKLLSDLEEVVLPRFGFDKTLLGVTVSVCSALYQQRVPFRHIGGGVMMIGQASKSLHLQNATVDSDSAIGAGIARDKRQTARLLRTAGMPVPQHIRVTSHGEALEAAAKLGWPVVVKPADLERSAGVTVDISQPEQLIEAYDMARRLTQNVMVEKQINGVCHRILVANGHVIYAVKRNPKAVIGNGQKTVAELIRDNNAWLKRSPPWKRLLEFPADDLAERCLKKAGLSMSSIPAAGQWVLLRPFVSDEWGGTVDDLSSDIHPENARLAIAASEALGLSIAGVDLMTEDLSKPWHDNGAVIIEMNHNPQFATLGRRAADDAFAAALLGGSGRIPVHVVTGHGDLLAHARQLRAKLDGKYYLTSSIRTEDETGTELNMPHSSLFERSLALIFRRDVAGLIIIGRPSEVLKGATSVDRLDSISILDDLPDRRQGLVAALSRAFPNTPILPPSS